jgi:hypothetical protein
MTDNTTTERIEPNPCGQCANFRPDQPNKGLMLDEPSWGFCTKKKMSVTTAMRIVLQANDPRCWKPKFIPTWARGGRP